MKVLVTGATGRVGRRFVNRLLDQARYEVGVFVRDGERVAHLTERDVDVAIGDLRDPAAVSAAVDGYDAVVHLAASFRGVGAAETARVTDRATRELADAALTAGVVRFVFPSTNLVYGPGRGRPAREDDDPRPPADSAYATSKFAAETALLGRHSERGLDVRILRLAFVYGDGDPHLGELVRLWAHAWPAHRRTHMVHHADVAQALLLALDGHGRPGGVYNLADDAPLSTYEVHRLIRLPLPEELASLPLEDPWEGIVEVERARQELAFRPIYPSAYAARAAGAL
jgi:nucleoside-diphosphate-sugar epimerase